jgi:2-polyprenyl-3-methyl-5-hydroxy-6-metoxy-1,4-benzoquinol methylase
MSASRRIIGLYEENAAAWDRQRGRDLHEAAWLERFASLLPAGASVLDLGCGMGEPIARWLIGRGFRVTGVDAAPSLVAMAQERFPDQQWIVADMRALDLGRRFDGLIAWHSLFHLSPADQRPMFARLAAHARPGAALMFTSGPEHGEAIGSWQSEPLYHGSLDPAEYERLLADSGFAVAAHRVRDPDCGEATIWLASKA